MPIQSEILNIEGGKLKLISKLNKRFGWYDFFNKH